MRKGSITMSAPATTLERPCGEAASSPHFGAIDGAAPPAAALGADFSLVTTRADFDALEGAWNDLFARAGRDTQLFQTFNWLWHWANHFLPRTPSNGGPQLAVVTASIDGRLVLVWPLVKERTGRITRLTWMGEPVSQYGDVLIDDVAEPLALLEAAWDFVMLQTGASVLHLRKVRADAAVSPLLARRGAKVVSELAAPYLDLKSAPSFAEYEKRYSSGARRNRKRQRRRLEERGPVALEVWTGGVAAQSLTVTAFKYKLAWLAERGIVSPALADPRTARFFVDATGSIDRPAGCHVLALTCNAHPVALEIGLRCKGRSAIHIIAYDLAYEKTAAGALLMEDSIRRAADEGLGVFDLLAPGDGYKLEWSDASEPVRDWAAARTIAGRVYVAVYLGLLRRAIKRGLDRLPVGIRRRVTHGLTRLLGHKE
jgi:CelD/BcsL family acetyltransferase involved in cellulose biosynthesis